MTTSLTTPTPPASPRSPASAGRRGLIAFGVVLAALVLPSVAFAVAQGADLAHPDRAPIPAQLALFGQALAPAIAALVAALVSRKRLLVGFRRTSWRSVAYAWLIGLAVTGSGVALVWLTGAATLDPDGLTAATGLPALAATPLALIIGVLPFLLLALPEQLGWSSFLAVRLADRRGRAAVAVVVGLAWAAFHVPLMLFVPGAVAPGVPAAYAVLMFVVQCIALAFPLVWLRLRTNSIWPVLVLHGTLNAGLYLVLEPMTIAENGWLAGEGGALTSLGVVMGVLLTAPLWRSERPLAARPRRAE